MMREKGKIILAGGSGFLGNLLSRWFADKGADVTILSRKRFASSFAKVVLWDGESLGEWSKELEGAFVLINLAGRSVDCRYNARNQKVLLDSRILSTRVLGEAVRQCLEPPKVWLNSSTLTIYEHTYGAAHSEDGRIAPSPDIKDEFSVQLATLWEEEFNNISCDSTRKVLLRIAMVFDRGGSVHQVLRRLVRFGLGGKMGHGKQFVSWIHSSDFCKAVQWIVLNETAAGIYNLASPNPVTNNEMMRLIREEGKGSVWITS